MSHGAEEKDLARWSRHWLLVPLIERDGSRSGFIWADDPSDSMLPSRERLQALRTFANQATMALRAAPDFETLNHGTASSQPCTRRRWACSSGRRASTGSSHTIVESACCGLVGTPTGICTLVDQQTGPAATSRAASASSSRTSARTVETQEGVPEKSCVTGKTVVVDDYSVWPDGLRGISTSSLHPRGRGSAAPRRGQGRRRDRDHPPRAAAVRSPGRSTLLERFAQLAVACARERPALSALCSRARSIHRQIVDCSTDLISVVDLEGTIVRHLALGLRNARSPAAGDGRDSISQDSSTPTTWAPRRRFLESRAGHARHHDRSCPPRRRQLGPARRNRQRDRRPGRAARSTSSRPAAT